MDRNEYISKVLAHISNKAFVNTIRQELENHISDREEYYVEIGYDVQSASQKAIEHMGNADTVGEEMNMLHNYKKHKIICTAGLTAFIILFLISWLLTGYLSWFFDWIIIPILCFSILLSYIVYRYSLISRNRAVMFLLGILSFIWGIHYADNLNLSWMTNAFRTDIISSLYSLFNSVADIAFFMNSIMCLTCSGEIAAMIKGNPNHKIFKRYKIYERLLLVFTTVCTIISVAMLTYSIA